jgi:Peptidase family C25/Bacterial Ig-like domain (group 3)
VHVTKTREPFRATRAASATQPAQRTRTTRATRVTRRATLRTLLIGALVLIGAPFIAPPAARAATTFVVNSPGDQLDLALDGVCDVDGAGTCTLRAAVTEANALAGLDVINFNIPGAATIALAFALPDVTSPVVIDGLTQPGSSCASFPATLQVEIDGIAIPPNQNRTLILRAGAVGSTIRGVAFARFPANGIGINVDASSVLIECNRFGIDRSGTVGNPLAVGTLLAINSAAANSIIGGIGRGNMFGGGAGDLLSLASTNNLVQGNTFDLDINGAYLPGARQHSIVIGGPGFLGNIIGGTAPGAGNRIRTRAVGIQVASGTGNQIRGNSIVNEAPVAPNAAAARFLLPIDLGPFFVFPPTQPTVNFNHQGVVAGPNRYQNYPVLTIASVTGSTTRVAGTLDGIAGRTYGIDVFATPVCHPSGFGAGGTYLGQVVTTADANGVASFDTNFTNGLGEPAGISTTATDLTTLDTSEMSYCRPSSTTNLTWATADPIAGSVSQYIGDRGQEKWFKFAVNPGDKVTVTLAGLPGSAVTLHRDPNPFYNGLTNPTSAAVLSAQAADSGFLPSGFLPSGFLPSGFLPSGFLPSGFLPSGFLPSGFLPSGFLPSGFLPSGFLPSGFLPSGFLPSGFLPSGFLPSGFLPSGFLPSGFLPSGFLPSGFLPSGFLPSGFLPSGFLPTGSTDAYASASRRSLLAVAADPYAPLQTIERNTYDLQENLYVRVVGPYSLQTPFQLSVNVNGGVCSTLQPVPSGLAVNANATNSNRKSVIVTDSLRLPGTATEKSAALSKLQTLSARADVQGVVVDLAGATYPRVDFARTQADAFPGCPSAKNMLATEIKAVIDAHKTANAGSVEYVVLAGGADVIPFHQVQDVAGLASEADYVPPVAPSTPSEAGLRLGLVAGQDFYGSDVQLSLNGRTIAAPSTAVGRLVDTAVDVSAAVDAYIATNGVVAPDSSLVTGYDFVGDAAAAIASDIAIGTGTAPDTLIQPPGGQPTAPSAWTATQLKAKLFAGNHDLVLLTGHFAAGNLLAADYTTELSASEVTASATSLANTVVLALGCHSGYTITSPDLLAGSSPDPDWAKAFLRKGVAGYIAATGYAYGDTELVEYGERLSVNLVQQMRTGTGPIPLGRALVAAKREYLATTAQMTGLDEKTLVAMTLYGLPMMKVDMPGARRPVPVVPTIVTSAADIAAGPGANTGLSSTTRTINPTLTQQTKVLANLDGGPNVTTTYFKGRDGVVANPFEPLLPKEINQVSLPGKVLRGVALRGGNYTDRTGITPLTASPNTETSGPHRSFNSDTFYPTQTWSPNFYDAVTGGATKLVTFPAQFRSTAPGATDGTLRTFDSVDLSFFYLPETWTAPASSAVVKAAAVSPAPEIFGASAAAAGSVVTFNVNVRNDGSAGVQQVWVLYTGLPGSPFHGTWAPIDLVADASPDPDPTVWTGTLNIGTANPGDLRFMVQAVNGAGLTSSATKLGAFYSVAATTASPPPPSSTQIAFTAAPASVAYQRPVTFSARLTPALSGRVVIFDVAGQQVQGVTDAGGNATATLTPVLTPGSYSTRATFRGEPDFLTSSAVTAFTVTKESTTLTLTPPTETVESGAPNTVVATVRDSIGRNLGGKSIVFVLTPTVGPPIVRTTIADFWGTAPLGPVDATPGTYSVVAHFGGTVPTSPPDANYLGSQSPSIALTINAIPPPTITASAKNDDLSTYLVDTWTKQNVTVSFVCADGVAVASCTAAQSVTTEGTTATVTGTAVNTRGISAATSFGPIKIDKTNPAISLTAPLIGASFTVGDVVNAAYTCTDALSGVASCVGTVPNGQAIDTATPGAKSFTVNAIDQAGNSSSTTANYTVASVSAPAPVVLANMGIGGLEDVGFPTNVVAVTGSFTNPGGQGPYTASVRWQAGATFSPLVLNNNSEFVAARVYPSGGTRVVTIRICNAAGQCGTDDITVRSAVTPNVTPNRECVVDRGGGTNPRYQARFGYNNAASYAVVLVTVPLVDNTFTATPYLRGQPQIFLPGSRTNVFTVGFQNGSITWRLNGRTATANSSSPRC